MATNPPKGDNRRQGVRQRSQTFNPKTEQWVKRDTEERSVRGREGGRYEI